mmetsp:Transcript_7893/g.21563  ORF Transcript_7893/g.21563 Transcript_7893/m.21563 type:complete len:286 (-) Transcript_7893:120-977(-)
MGCGASSASSKVDPEPAAVPEPQPKADPAPAQQATTASALPLQGTSGAAAPEAPKEPAAPKGEGEPAPAQPAQPAGVPAQPAEEKSPAPPEVKLRQSSQVLPQRVGADELGQLCQATNFDRKQVERLYDVFKVVSSSDTDDGLIDKNEFESSLGLSHSLFSDRIFQLFDKNSDGNISFDEFVTGLSVFSARASREDKTDFSFRIYDMDGDGKISQAELGDMVRATIQEHGLQLTDEQFTTLIDTTFQQAGTDAADGIDLTQYHALVKQRPAMLANMTIASLNVSR